MAKTRASRGRKKKTTTRSTTARRKKKTTTRSTAARRKKKTTTARRTKASGGRTLKKWSNTDLRREADRRRRGLLGDRARLMKELARVERAIADLPGTVGIAGAATPPRRRPRNEMSLVEALQKLLKGKTMSVTDMCAAVQQAGYRTTSPNFRTIVNQTLINHPKLFKRVSRGKYTAK